MNRNPKIVFITENITWGGSELLWFKTVIELVKKKYLVTICVSQKLQLPNELLVFESKNKIIIYRIAPPQLNYFENFLNKFLPYRFRYKPKQKINQLIKKIAPNLLVINQGYNFNGVDLMFFAKQNSMKYVTISHAVNECLWPNLQLRQKMIAGYFNSMANFFVSQDNLEVTQTQLGKELSNAEVVRNPFNVPYLTNLEYPQTDNFNLAFVGRFDFFAKGQDVLLRVLAQPKWKKRKLTVNFYGEGQDIENIKDLIQFHKIENAVVHSHSETIDIWKKNQGLILTSRFEGLPLVLVEAMLSKRFVIVTNVSGNKELVCDNVTGFLAAAPRPEYIDEALERAWERRNDWEKMGEEANKYIISQIPQNPALVFADKLETILNSND
jgi:glycosyltransferase involved in cell wall biosynthesis